ncbi:uncharacterized protein LOC112690664 isoform X2 [Sipha flava]|uniref:Fanconi-associated nuclease n=1 Tax=Sipha flava TaxID=143950 RepID=A0A8B8GD25_9HEMI|nr:uncharacterized protein LOC112690664 isoform X2 [Sipha flava]
MDSTSPFTPKRSRIKRKTSGEINSVSRTLLFDDSHSRSPFNKNLEFSPLSQQAILPCENELIKPEQITPIKMEHSDFKKNNKILVSPSIKNRPNRFNIDEETKISIKSSSRKRNSSNNSTPSKKFKSIGSENCKPITYYFQPIQKITLPLTNKIDDYFKSATEQRSNEEKIKINIESTVKSEFLTNNVDFSKENHIKSPTTALSPHTQNRKKKNSKITDVKSQLSIEQVTKQLHFPSQVTPTKNGKINHIMNTPTKSPRIIDLLQNKVTITGGDTYSRFIKYIVLKAEIFFLCEDGIMTIIDSCTDDELKIFGRLIARKHGWIRADEPDGLKKYKELNLCHDFDSVLMSLATKQLINTDVYSCELDCLLNILKAHELKKLQKTFKINSASNKSQTKPEMIKSFMNLVNKQRTIRGNSSTNLKECIKKILGYCLKLSDSIRDDIMSCLIYESYPYFNGDEKDRFRDCFTKFSMVEKKELKFPTFNVKRVSINFNSKDSLEMYKNALNLRQEVQLSLEKKDHENAIKVLKVVFEKFKSAVHDKCIRDSFLELPTYLRKYSAVSVYAHVLFKNISILKKSTANKNLAKEVLEYLLKHKEFSMSKIPDLHIELAKVFESQFKQLNNAATVILDGLKDKTISELGHQMLSSRAMIYVNRKIRKLDDNLKEELLTFISNTKKQLPNTTINGKIISTTEKYKIHLVANKYIPRKLKMEMFFICLLKILLCHTIKVKDFQMEFMMRVNL